MSATSEPEREVAIGKPPPRGPAGLVRRHKWLILSAVFSCAIAAGALIALRATDSSKPRTTCHVHIRPTPPAGLQEYVYAFTDPNVEKLELARQELAGRGYRLLRYSYGTCPDSSPRCSEMTLELALIEEHTAATMALRESDLCELARAYRLQSYRGFRMGKSTP